MRHDSPRVAELGGRALQSNLISADLVAEADAQDCAVSIVCIDDPILSSHCGRSTFRSAELLAAYICAHRQPATPPPMRILKPRGSGPGVSFADGGWLATHKEPFHPGVIGVLVHPASGSRDDVCVIGAVGRRELPFPNREAVDLCNSESDNAAGERAVRPEGAGRRSPGGPARPRKCLSTRR